MPANKKLTNFARIAAKDATQDKKPQKHARSSSTATPAEVHGFSVEELVDKLHISVD